MFGWSKQQYSPIGIDFGADTLKLLQVTAGDPPQMVAAAAAELPFNTRSEPSARYAFFQEALRSLLKLQPFKGKAAVLSIPAYQTLVQQVQLTRSEHDDPQAQIELHLRQRLNIDPSRMVIRTYPVGQVMRDGSAREETVVVAAGRDTVMRHIEIARKCGLDVVGMQSEPVAVLKAFGHMFRQGKEQERTTAFIDIGAVTSKIIIAHGTNLAFAKMIAVGGDQFTRQRATAAHIDFAEAREQRKREASNARENLAKEDANVAVPTLDTAQKSEAPGGAGLAVLEAAMAAETARIESSYQHATPPTVIPSRHSHGNGHGSNGNNGSRHGEAEGDALECLTDELQLCLRYHQSLFGDRPVEKLVFLGGEAQQVAICQRIARALRIGAQLGDPLARVTRGGMVTGKGPVGVDIRKPQPGWAVPLGLCLCEGEL